MGICVDVVARQVDVITGVRSIVLVQVPAGRGPRGRDGLGVPVIRVNEQTGDVLRWDGVAGAYRNVALTGWDQVEIASGEAVLDVANADKFAVVVTAACALRIGAALPGVPFMVRLLMTGAHAVTLGAEFKGETPDLSASAGDEIVIAGAVLDAAPEPRAIVNLAKIIPA